MFERKQDLATYVIENYPEITDSRINENHWDFLCAYCKVARGFQVVQRIVNGTMLQYGTYSQDFSAPITYIFRCPVCHAFKLWIIFELQLKNAEGKFEYHYYRVTSLPSEGLEDISELPEDPPSLRIAYRQAIRAMDANANLAAAAMFRRALQIITRNMLGAKPGNLANELKEVVGKSYNSGTVTADFANIGYVIKEAGNQGSHPDQDPDLLDFTPKDAEDLQQIFMELVSELFVIPAAAQKAKQDFMARRKIKVISP